MISDSAIRAFTLYPTQAYQNCWNVDSSGLKDPRLHESAKISCLYNLARLESEKGNSKVGVGVRLCECMCSGGFVRSKRIELESRGCSGFVANLKIFKA